MAKKSYHVVSNPNGGWSVLGEGAARASKRFETQRDAIHWASVQSRKDGTELVVHKRDGTIESKSPSQRDPHPHPPRDSR